MSRHTSDVTGPWLLIVLALLAAGPHVVAGGKDREPIRVVTLAKHAAIDRGQALEIPFDGPIVPVGKAAHVFFRARVDTKAPSGYRHSAMVAELNGQALSSRRLSNRPTHGLILGGVDVTFVSPKGYLMVPYTPSAAALASSSRYRIMGGAKGDEFELNVAGLLKPGQNRLVLRNLLKPDLAHSYPVVVDDVSLVIKPEVKSMAFKPAPTGPLPVYVPKKELPKTYSGLTREPGRIRFAVGGQPFVVQTRFSSPDGRWCEGSSPFYSHDRKVIELGEWIEVHDTFTNLTDRNIPVMQTHSCALSDRVTGVWLACQKFPEGSGAQAEAANPTVFATSASRGIGLVALDDVFRVHCRQEAPSQGTIRLADRQFYLEPGKGHTSEWAIVPTVEPDQWAFVNATRRLMDANFTLHHQFAFLLDRVHPDSWSDARLKQFVECKSADIVCRGLLFDHKYKGRYAAHGLAFETLTGHFRTYFTDFRKRLDRLFPDGRVKMADYYHCYLDATDDSAERFRACRNVDATGKHRTYGSSYDYLHLYVPTLDNAWGKAMARGIDIRLNTAGIDAIYWDEFNASAGAYTYNMQDGCSADIDPETLRIRRLKGSVHLLSRDWLATQAKRIMARVPLIVNGSPKSRTIARLRIQNFVETASITNCRRALLASPVALGDHLSEETEQDAYRSMLRALDWGCLYNWYHDKIVPTHKTLAEHMFPFTPVELHEGYVIGRERILTNRSGRFGWGDDSDMTIHVYDRHGRASDSTQSRKVTRDGETYAEIRILEGFSAAVVRLTH